MIASAELLAEEQRYRGGNKPRPHAVATGDEGEPQRRRPGVPTLDSLSFSGANKLAEQIRKYWRSCNAEIEISVEQIEGFKFNYQIRSNLVGALPPKA